MNKITENEIELFAIELLDKFGYRYIYTPYRCNGTRRQEVQNVRSERYL